MVQGENQLGQGAGFTLGLFQITGIFFLQDPDFKGYQDLNVPDCTSVPKFLR